ncbi:hypothetical protein EC973_004408 [Apophysomyces ossiformis]|uniref:Galactose oxidase n=1 Tax=Apophysomyces ossiformis TaxID=679940 RepID=A0A8H7ESI4_9FUNG|nr:hypothetical protein EC973_004408 [Apophysomyces ossiformis]
MIYLRRGALAALDAQNRIFFWGGISEAATGYPSGVGIWNAFMVIEPSFVWGGVNTTNACPQQIARLAGTATTSLDNNIIYYIGGVNAFIYPGGNPNATNPYQVYPTLMSDILTFDTATLTWTLNTATGKLPSGRVYHTAVHLPNSNGILLYGGGVPVGLNGPTETVNDYCYVLNMSTFIWTQINDLGPLPGAGPRFGHAAVVHGNRSMFILFGQDQNGNERSDFQVMDLATFQWTNVYRANDQYNTNSTVPNTTPNKQGEGQAISAGAIAGIVIGSVAFVTIIAAIVALSVIRRRRQMKNVSNIDSSHQHPQDMAKDNYNNMEESPSIYRRPSIQDTAYLSDNDKKREHGENIPFITAPPALHDEETRRTGIATYTPSLVMSPTDGSTVAYGHDMDTDKPDGHIPRYNLEPVKPDGI